MTPADLAQIEVFAKSEDALLGPTGRGYLLALITELRAARNALADALLLRDYRDASDEARDFYQRLADSSLDSYDASYHEAVTPR